MRCSVRWRGTSPRALRYIGDPDGVSPHAARNPAVAVARAVRRGTTRHLDNVDPWTRTGATDGCPIGAGATRCPQSTGPVSWTSLSRRVAINCFRPVTCTGVAVPRCGYATHRHFANDRTGRRSDADVRPDLTPHRDQLMPGRRWKPECRAPSVSELLALAPHAPVRGRRWRPKCRPGWRCPMPCVMRLCGIPVRREASRYSTRHPAPFSGHP